MSSSIESLISKEYEHGFVTDFVRPTLTLNAQHDIANFVMSDTLPLRVQHD